MMGVDLGVGGGVGGAVENSGGDGSPSSTS